MFLRAFALLFLLALFAPASQVRAAAPPATDVDIALVLVVDISESVKDDEYTFEKAGLASALTNPEIVAAIQGGAIGRIAVSVVDFSSQAALVVPWHIIANAKDAREFATEVLAVRRSDQLGIFTSISAGMFLADQLIAASGYRATRRVIDISGDGPNNSDEFGIDISVATEMAKHLKITVNGLPILGVEPDVDKFYREYVITGRDAFLIPAANVTDFARAIRRKLVREIS